MAVKLAVKSVDNGVSIFILSGTLDAPGTIDVEGEFQNLLREKGGKIIVDLSGLDYMSSYGLRMLLLGAKRLAEAGGEMHLAAPKPRVMELIKLAGYDTIFPVHTALDDALQSTAAT